MRNLAFSFLCYFCYWVSSFPYPSLLLLLPNVQCSNMYTVGSYTGLELCQIHVANQHQVFPQICIGTEKKGENMADIAVLKAVTLKPVEGLAATAQCSTTLLTKAVPGAERERCHIQMSYTGMEDVLAVIRLFTCSSSMQLIFSGSRNSRKQRKSAVRKCGTSVARSMDKQPVAPLTIWVIMIPSICLLTVQPSESWTVRIPKFTMRITP